MQHLRIIAFITLLAAVTKASLELPSTAKPKDQIDNLEKKNGSLNTSQILEPVESHLDDPNYFEGDLIVSPETIEAYYGKPNQTANERGKRAVTSNRNLLWPRGIVYYTYDSTIDTATQSIILGAIREIERETCLQFQHRCTSSNLIVFTGSGTGCTSYIGRRGGRQLITLPTFTTTTCRTHRTVLHEICHALGMWHEQSRPDRDLYVQVLNENIEMNKRDQFNKRLPSEIDHHRQGYDYASVMHYRLNAFSTNGRDTLRRRTTNLANSAYIRQGRPNIGRENRLSASDIIQLNRMYGCNSRGRLRFYARHGINLQDRDGWFAGRSDPYVRVIAYSNFGYSKRLQTRHDQGDQSPEWNQWLDFGIDSWTRFTVQVFDRDVGSDDSLSSTTTYYLNNTRISRRNVRKNCNRGHIYFDYFFQP